MRYVPLALLALLLPLVANALEPEDGAVFVRVIDTGPGHASVTVMPGGYFMVYDTGHWNHDDLVFRCVKELIPDTLTPGGSPVRPHFEAIVTQPRAARLASSILLRIV